jgi:hypothetical protein
MAEKIRSVVMYTHEGVYPWNQAHMNSNLVIPTFEFVRIHLERAIDTFLGREAELFAAYIGERALTGSLAPYLRREFAPWDADAEYDRFGCVRKRTPVESRRRSKHPHGHLVTPDIIIHHRLRPTENLLAIEAKSDDDRRGTGEDREKLASYLGAPLRYVYVALLVFGSTDLPACSYELFRQGDDPKIPIDARQRTAPRVKAASSMSPSEGGLRLPIKMTAGA